MKTVDNSQGFGAEPIYSPVLLYNRPSVVHPLKDATVSHNFTTGCPDLLPSLFAKYMEGYEHRWDTSQARLFVHSCYLAGWTFQFEKGS